MSIFDIQKLDEELQKQEFVENMLLSVFSILTKQDMSKFHQLIAAINRARVLRSSCEESRGGFRVHLPEGEWDAITRLAEECAREEASGLVPTRFCERHEMHWIPAVGMTEEASSCPWCKLNELQDEKLDR